jgi:hypothetical protein
VWKPLNAIKVKRGEAARSHVGFAAFASVFAGQISISHEKFTRL